MEHNCVFPFCAVMGQEKIKTALLLNIINPAIGGLLISGEKGTAKSTLVRGLAAVLDDVKVIDLPLNITEDRLIGTLDLETAIQEGKRRMDPGLLHRADGNILYVDEVNLLSDYIVNCLLEVSASHVNRVEREGISCTHPSRFVLVGTMNPEEGSLRPQLLDRFGLFVEARGSDVCRERQEIIRRRLEYEGDRAAYLEKWRDETGALAEKITAAKSMLAEIGASENIMRLAAQFAIEGGCAGNRAEIAIVETARALAAWDQRTHIIIDDVKQAAELALPHRVRPKQEMECQPDNFQDPPRNEEQHDEEASPDDPPEATDEAPPDQNRGSTDTPQEKPDSNQDKGPDHPPLPDSNQQEKVDEPGDIYQVKSIDIRPTDRKKRRGSGKRSRTVTHALQGRYIRYTFPHGKIRDIALDATLRAAAPYQKTRDKHGLTVAIKKSDLRQKVREKRTGSTILFVVDASGSMGVKQRMKAVKGAILSLLNDAYQKRDKVGMIAFRKDDARLLLGITRSVDLAQKMLAGLPTGGKTPLASGLYKAYEILKAARLKDPDMVPLLVLVTDGRTNASINGGHPVQEALEAAGKIAAEGIKALVIDSEKDFIKLELAARIAYAMGADYYRLEDLKENEIEYIVRGAV